MARIRTPDLPTNNEPQTAPTTDDHKNPFNEPMGAPEDYTDGYEASAPRPVAAETSVEHPLSPTDTNPNPHGNRDEPFTAVVTKEGGRTEPEEGSATVTALVDGLHLGDGRVLAKGHSASVTPEIAKTLTTGDHKGKARRG